MRAPAAAGRPTGRPKRVTCYPTGLARLDELGEQHARLVVEWADAAAVAKQRVQERRAAEAEDARASVDAVKAGKPDRGETRTAKASVAVAEAQRAVRIRLLAANEIADDLVAEFDRRRVDVEAIVRDRVGEARARALAALDELDAALDELTEARREAHWIRRGPRAEAALQLVPSERVRLGELRFEPGVVARHLRAAVEAPAPAVEGSTPVESVHVEETRLVME